MFVIDYVKHSDSNRIVVPPFHSGHLGLLPRSADQHIALLQSAPGSAGCELCITPYERELEYLFRLKCVLLEKRGVVNKLLRAIAALGINILSWESATLESNGGHGVFMLLDWSTTASPEKVPLPKNLQGMFFPRLSGVIPANDLRYVRLLRQILGQCADVLIWDFDRDSGTAVPRLRLNEFEESRVVQTRGSIELSKATERKVRLDDAGVAFEIDSRVAADTRMATARDHGDPLHYILVSDIESKTLRVFIPRRGREKRMAHLGFSHKNLPGALCAITEVIAASQLSIVSGLVRKMTDERNILEVTVEHESREMSRAALVEDSSMWALRHLDLEGDRVKEWLRYYRVALQPPLYPKDMPFSPVALYDGGTPPETVTIVTAERAEKDVQIMASRAATDDDFAPRRWLTNLMFAPEWGPQGKPSVFLSYPRGAATEAALVRQTLGSRFHYIVLQDADVEHITEGAIEKILQAHCFIGIWHPEKVKGGKPSLSPWMPFEYGVALSHNKQCVILSHHDLPEYLADRISRDTARIIYSNLATEPERLKDLERRCEPWEAGHRRLSLSATRRTAKPRNAANVYEAKRGEAMAMGDSCGQADTIAEACMTMERGKRCEHARRSNSLYCGCHAALQAADEELFGMT